MSDSQSPRRKQLRHRARYRGFKEVDILFGRFAERHLDGLDEAGLDAFEALLDAPDQDVYAWVTGQLPLPAPYDTGVFHLLRDPGIERP